MENSHLDKLFYDFAVYKIKQKLASLDNIKNYNVIRFNNDIKIIRISDKKELLIACENVDKTLKNHHQLIDHFGFLIDKYYFNKNNIETHHDNNCEDEIIERLDLLSDKMDLMLDKIDQSDDICDETWIVQFKSNFDPNTYQWPDDITILENYDHAYFGMACRCSHDQISSLQNDCTGIDSFVLDQEFKITALKERQILTLEQLKQVKITNQSIGAFINRTGAIGSSQKSGDGIGNMSNFTNINVFVVDTGIAFHPELNIVGGRNFTTSNINAWVDDNGHGTHVSGIIGARDNTIGIVGIAPGIRLWSIKVLSASGSGSAVGIISALDWILKNRGIIWQGIGIVNMSLGGGVYTPLDTAVNTLLNNGIIVCVAAGNSSQNAAFSSPARVPNAITVAASSPLPSYNILASFSNYGSLIDIIAPGTYIWSTYLNQSYARMSGTSMACPVIVGTCALMMSTQAIPVTKTLSFVTNVRNTLVNNSALLNPKYYNGTTGSNQRVSIPVNIICTNIDCWAGRY